MALQVNVKDILSQLYHNRHVVEFLFANRENITVNELLARDDLSADQYQRLRSLDLVYEYENIVELFNAFTISWLSDITSTTCFLNFPDFIFTNSPACFSI